MIRKALWNDLTMSETGAVPTLYAMGGAIRRVRPHETAFVHRDARFFIAYQTTWSSPADDRANFDWCESIYAAMRPYVSGYAYQNYIDSELPDWAHAYYGANYPRLQRVKARYDPRGLFRFAQRSRHALRIQRVLWYPWRDSGHTPEACTFCGSTGLIRRDGAAKPAWRAFRRIAAN